MITKYKAYLPYQKKIVDVIQINWNDDGTIWRIGYIKEVIQHEHTKELVYKYTENFVLLQFTGLLDETNAEVYDGDIIEEGLVYWDDVSMGWFVELLESDEPSIPLYDIPFTKIIGSKFLNKQKLFLEIKDMKLSDAITCCFEKGYLLRIDFIEEKELNERIHEQTMVVQQ